MSGYQQPTSPRRETVSIPPSVRPPPPDPSELSASAVDGETRRPRVGPLGVVLMAAAFGLAFATCLAIAW